MLQITSVLAQDLIVCLETLTPIKLIGLALLEGCQPTPGGWFPDNVSTEQVVAATIQIILYGDTCKRMVDKLTALRAVPVPLAVMEYRL
jgi:hypothetical protein